MRVMENIASGVSLPILLALLEDRCARST
jgi:hypothetical protein